jgi:cyanophycinase
VPKAGLLLLEGGAEFGGAMAEPDRQGLALAGGPGTNVVILPTAAAPDRNHRHAGVNAVRWFQSLGASQVEVVNVIDDASAGDSKLAEKIRSGRLIYLLGGFPRYLEETLRNSRAWEAAMEAYASGAVVAGSSAGAMVLSSHYYDPDSDEVRAGLGLLPNSCVLPHHNSFGRTWAGKLLRRLPDATLIGIDEHTGALGGTMSKWSVYGAGNVTLYQGGTIHHVRAGQTYRL